jgi:uncharacterized protein (DUF983 family)
MEVLLVLFYAAIIGGLAAAGVFLYLRAAASRRRYCCPHCGERFRVELMTASHCNVCGTPVRHPMKQRGST